jgi:hypothetical protein
MNSLFISLAFSDVNFIKAPNFLCLKALNL